MKKLLSSTIFVRFRGDPQSSRVSVSLFSTKTLNPSSPSFLYDRIQVIRDPRVSIVPVLNQWVQEGRPVLKHELQSLLHLMKDFRRFNHALEISQWMTDRRYFSLSPSDVAVSYVREKSVEKAEAIMQKMRESGMATSSFPYNVLINLYSQAGEHKKIDILMQEMEMKGISQDMFTLRNRLSAYAAASDISRVEKILHQMEEDPHNVVDWKSYSVAANGYLKAGLIEKALTMLKKMEWKMPLLRRKYPFENLLTLYASTGHKDELYRVWNLYKPSNEVLDASYACMITALAKLDDIAGAEKIFQEWEFHRTMYDFRVLNRLLVAYCKKGLINKAESVVKKAIEGRTPYASTWNILAIGYMEHKQMPKAVEMLKNAMFIGRQGWRPNTVVLAACLEYLEGQGDIKGLEEIVRLYKNSGPLTRDIYHRLLRTYIAAGQSISEVLDQMKMDGFTADEETHKILESRTSL
ncbi:hypothetical protein L1049_023915 [Liquidambar formosana]|uniref:PROP1-like PPR domain-containing protein n=1 Tax=Liquidambar formosana TaxID=63359 RepID=A0AAP0X3Z5_LIQFO